MRKIGEYQYPDLASFSETLEIAKEAINRFGGIMPNLSVVQKLGYNVKNPAGISGYIYRRFDDMEMWGLFKRERGNVRVTDLAKQAIDPYNRENSIKGRRKAIAMVPIVAKAFEEWKGELPDDEAFPARLVSLTSADWTEARKHSEPLKSIMADSFSYLRDSEGANLVTVQTPEAVAITQQTTPLPESFPPSGALLGELKTVIGSVVIRNGPTLKLARNILDVLEGEIQDRTTTESSVDDKGKQKDAEARASP